jgi:hypothetical protein
MRDWDIQVLFHFIRRPGMYTGSSKINDFKRIDIFLMAYEMGAMGECRFKEKLIKQIEDKYGVHLPSEGLVKQLRRASKKVNQEIREFFINESMEILIAESDHDNQNKFISYGRRQLIQQLEQFPKEVNINWVSNFSREIRELKAWTGANLTNEEMAKSERLVDEVNQLIKSDVMKLVNVPENIEILKKELLKKLYEHLR